VADPDICHGASRRRFAARAFFVSDMLEMVAEGLAWKTMIEEWHDSIT
jgi:hypothetical protein